jgi:hypothetical protein
MENHMKNFLQDLVAHTHSLGFLPLVKVSSTTKETSIESMAVDRSVIVNAKTHSPVDDFEGVFGMPNLNKLDIHLKCPEYKENATISVVKQERNGETIPTGLHFENGLGDFQNDYRFMNQDIINEQLKSVKFKGAKWDIEFQPSMASIQRLKFQANAHSEELTFQVKTEGNDLVFSFGDASTHAGSFVFQAGVDGKLRQTWSWPVNQVQSILNLNGDITMRIADAGALNITVDSGIAVYEYILPAQSK